MSNMVVNTNVLALNSHRSMKLVGNIQSKASERLSSGLKINSAADDAAGLAISEKMRAQIRGLDMASKNAQDGISLIQTAEGGMQEIDNMIQRIRELTVAVSNDTNEHNELGTGDRQKMQDEVDQLVAEIDSMAGRVEFNKKKVINGDYSDPVKMLGDISSKLAVAQANLTNATGIRDAARTQADAANADLNKVKAISEAYAAGKSTLEGNLKTAEAALNLLTTTATVADGNGVTASGTVALQAFAKELSGIKHDHITEATIKDLVSKYFAVASGETENSQNQAIIDGNATGGITEINVTFTGTLNEGDLAAALGIHTSDTGNTTALTTAVNSIITAAINVFKASNELAAYDTDKAAVTASASAPASAAGFFNTAYAGATNGYDAITLTATGNTTIAAGAMKNSSDLTAQMNKVSITNATAVGALDTAQKEMDVYSEQVERYTNQIKLANERLTALGGQTPGLYFQVGANAGQGLQTSIGSVKSDILGIGDGKGVTTIDFLKATGADITNTLNVLDEALSYVTTERSKLGATQNRLEYTIKSLDISSENLSASESRIRDTDMAKEMMNLTKANVLQQAAISMLAQANQAPQSVLQLLQ